MTAPIWRGDHWWVRTEDGSWLVWDDETSAWIATPFAPPPPAPPTPPSSFEYAEVGALGRLRRARWLAAVVVLTMAVAVGAFELSQLFIGDRIDTPLISPPAAPDAPSTPNCLDDVLPMPVEDADGNVVRHISRIARAVERLRDLEFRSIPQPQFRSSDQLENMVARQVRRSYTRQRADQDARLLTLLGAIEPGTNLRDLLARTAGEQITGFYVPRTKRLVVEAAGARRELSPFSELVLSHELEHALADQRLGLNLDDDPAPSELDAATARRALIEGDATFTMQRYAQASLGVNDQFALSGDPAVVGASAGLEELPHYLVRSLEFPYVEGLRFVCHLYDDGGWRAVDRAYADGPTTTAEILFPERYLESRSNGQPPPSLGQLPGEWRRVQRGAFGAADLLFLFEAPGGDTQFALEDPRAAAGAWMGGALELWVKRGHSALGVSLRPADGTDLCAPIEDWYRRSFPLSRDRSPQPGERLAVVAPRQAAVLRCALRAIGLGIAPSLDEARALIRGDD